MKVMVGDAIITSAGNGKLILFEVNEEEHI
jgi:hypothetical protein